MYSTIEDPIFDARSLRRWLRDLEEDEGMRVVGNMRRYRGGGFVFVGIRQGKYRVNMCDRIWDGKKRVYLAGEGGEWREFESFEDVWRFIRSVARRPVQAWVY